MNLPANTKSPFFAYGLFKPGQLCYFRIKKLIESKNYTEVNGILKERDGIPLLILSDHSRIKGVLMQFTNGKEIEAYERILEIEPDEIQINTPLRPCTVLPLSRNELDEIEKSFSGLPTISVYHSHKPITDPLDKLELIKRRRMEP